MVSLGWNLAVDTAKPSVQFLHLSLRWNIPRLGHKTLSKHVTQLQAAFSTFRRTNPVIQTDTNRVIRRTRRTASFVWCTYTTPHPPTRPYSEIVTHKALSPIDRRQDVRGTELAHCGP